MNQLINITQNENNDSVVSGRELHGFLEVTERYSTWFERMVKYGFEENVDFVGCKVFNTLAKQELQDHALKLDMAKEISMIQRTAKGKEARQYFIEVEKRANKAKLSKPQDDYAKRLRAEAMNQNARNRAAKELIEMAKDATSEVNKALLQDKAIEVLTGEKLLEMPKLAGKMYSTDEIAKELGIYSKSDKPHGTAVSWLIKRYLELKDGDYEVFAESVNGWSGTVTRYSCSVVERLKEKIESLGYPTVVTSEGGVNYHVHYRNIA